MLIKVSALALLAGALAAPLAIAAPTAVAKYKNWSVFTETVSGETLCYAATPATDLAPREANHGDVWFYVSNWRSGKARNQPSLKVGFDLRADLPGKANIGRSSWTMYGMGKEAFSADGDDPKLVSALKKGRELRVQATSERNTRVTYHFSLSGSSSAIDRAASACR